MSEKRLAVISIIAEKRDRSAEINSLLSAYGEYMVGRLGIPYREKSVYVLSVVIDAPAEVINTLTGKIGMLEGVTAKKDIIKDIVNKVVSGYTLEEMKADQTKAQDEILSRLRRMFDSDFIVSVAFPTYNYE